MSWTHFKWHELVLTVHRHVLNTCQMTWPRSYCAHSCFEYTSTDLSLFSLCIGMVWTHFKWLSLLFNISLSISPSRSANWPRLQRHPMSDLCQLLLVRSEMWQMRRKEKQKRQRKRRKRHCARAKMARRRRRASRKTKRLQPSWEREGLERERVLIGRGPWEREEERDTAWRDHLHTSTINTYIYIATRNIDPPTARCASHCVRHTLAHSPPRCPPPNKNYTQVRIRQPPLHTHHCPQTPPSKNIRTKEVDHEVVEDAEEEYAEDERPAKKRNTVGNEKRDRNKARAWDKLEDWLHMFFIDRIETVVFS